MLESSHLSHIHIMHIAFILSHRSHIIMFAITTTASIYTGPRRPTPLNIFVWQDLTNRVCVERDWVRLIVCWSTDWMIEKMADDTSMTLQLKGLDEYNNVASISPPDWEAVWQASWWRRTKMLASVQSYHFIHEKMSRAMKQERSAHQTTARWWTLLTVDHVILASFIDG